MCSGGIGQLEPMLLEGKRALTMTCEKVDFQVHLYEKLCIPFERSQKVI